MKKIDLLFSFIILFTFFINDKAYSMGDTYLPYSPKELFMVSSGYGYNCTLDAEDLKCWDNDSSKLRKVPLLKNPIQVNAGTSRTCAIDQEGVKCWKYQDKNPILTEVPSLKNPFQVSVGYGAICALDEEGVKCWGDEVNSNWNIPKLNNPVQVNVGGGFACALESGGEVKCWGPGGGKFSEWLSEFKNIKQISIGGYEANYIYCIIYEQGQRCGHDIYGPWKDISQISSGGLINCNLTNGWLNCGGSTSKYYSYTRKTNDVIQVSSGGSHVCALLGNGVECWGLDKKFEVPTSLDFNLGIIKKISNAFTPARHNYSLPLIEFIENKKVSKNSQEAYFLMSLFSSAIVTESAQVFLNTYIPRYTYVLSNFKKVLKYSSTQEGLDKTPDTVLTRQLALTSIRSSLNVGAKFLTLEEAIRFQEIIRLVGIAYADPMNNNNIKNVTDSVDLIENEKVILSRSVKSAFLVGSLDFATQWLKERI